MRRKRGTVQQRDDVSQSDERCHRGGEREKMTLVGLTRILLDKKMKKIHAVNSPASNRR
jgi:hypothetical protein